MNIKELRASIGMTQKEFSEYFDIPDKTIKNWEQGTRKTPGYLIKLIEYKIKKEELVMKKCKEVLNKAREIMEGVYVQNLPELIIGDEVKLADVWDGNGDVPTESYSYQISEAEWINYEFEVIEENEDTLDTVVKITDIELL